MGIVSKPLSEPLSEPLSDRGSDRGLDTIPHLEGIQNPYFCLESSQNRFPELFQGSGRGLDRGSDRGVDRGFGTTFVDSNLWPSKGSNRGADRARHRVAAHPDHARPTNPPPSPPVGGVLCMLYFRKELEQGNFGDQ